MEMGGYRKTLENHPEIGCFRLPMDPLPDYQRVLQCIGQTFLATNRVTLSPKILFIVSNYPNNPLNQSIVL